MISKVFLLILCVQFRLARHCFVSFFNDVSLHFISKVYKLHEKLFKTTKRHQFNKNVDKLLWIFLFAEHLVRLPYQVKHTMCSVLMFALIQVRLYSHTSHWPLFFIDSLNYVFQTWQNDMNINNTKFKTSKQLLY